MKLYWRVKRNGKWTWRPVRQIVRRVDGSITIQKPWFNDGEEE